MSHGPKALLGIVIAASAGAIGYSHWIQKKDIEVAACTVSFAEPRVPMPLTHPHIQLARLAARSPHVRRRTCARGSSATLRARSGGARVGRKKPSPQAPAPSSEPRRARECDQSAGSKCCEAAIKYRHSCDHVIGCAPRPLLKNVGDYVLSCTQARSN